MRRRDHIGVAFTDLLFNALLGFVVMFILAFLLINPVAKSGAVDPKAEFLITLTWPDGREEDLDLYVEDPTGELVWFRQREAGLMHLDRDDLGQRNDMIQIAGRYVINPLNQEVVSIRGIVPGEYVVNLHLYRAAGDQAVPATVKIEKLNPQGRAGVLRAADPHRGGRRADRGALLGRHRRPGARGQSVAQAARAAAPAGRSGRPESRHDRRPDRPRGELAGARGPAAQPQPSQRMALAGQGGRDRAQPRLSRGRLPGAGGDARLADRSGPAGQVPASRCVGG